MLHPVPFAIMLSTITTSTVGILELTSQLRLDRTETALSSFRISRTSLTTSFSCHTAK